MAKLFTSTARVSALRGVAALFATAALVLATAASAAAQSASWLDDPMSASWNTPGMAIPAAPSIGQTNPRCGATARWAETPQDQSLVDTGWSLFNAYQSGWGMVVASGAGGYDGMCRPIGYQGFAYVDGQFAGTISPDPMNSRESGAGQIVAVRQDGLSVRYVRYASTDPLCCPSLGAVLVDFGVERTPTGPVLKVVSSYTEPPATPQ
jgi:hypothetical protein